MYFASFIAASSSASGAPIVLCAMFALALLAPLLAGFIWGPRHTATLCEMTQVQGVYRIAKDGRSFLQVGRACYFGRRGETEADLRARLGV